MENKSKYPVLENCTIAIIGLGYVGLPLAIEFSKKQRCKISQKILKRKIIGFDINPQRLEELKKGIDSTNEVSEQELLNTSFFDLTNQIESIAQADVFIITVPTPIDAFKKPDLEPIQKASITVGKALKIRAQSLNTTIPIVIYESTVYPGTTEEICIPIIEKISGLKLNEHFCCGFSPERINPGTTILYSPSVPIQGTDAMKSQRLDVSGWDSTGVRYQEKPPPLLLPEKLVKVTS